MTLVPLIPRGRLGVQQLLSNRCRVSPSGRAMRLSIKGFTDRPAGILRPRSSIPLCSRGESLHAAHAPVCREQLQGGFVFILITQGLAALPREAWETPCQVLTQPRAGGSITPARGTLPPVTPPTKAQGRENPDPEELTSKT